MDDPSPQLEYAPRPPAMRSARLRRGVLVVVLGAMIVGTALIAPRIIGYVRLLRLQRQCLAYAPPPTQVVLETDPAEAKKLLAADARYHANAQSSLAYFVPPQWPAFYVPVGGGFRTTGTAFLHERTTPRGERRLVAVDVNFVPQPFGSHVVSLGARIVHPGSAFRSPKPLITFIEGDGAHLAFDSNDPRLTIFAGQPDPNDASHFTIDVQLGGVRRTLDGWLAERETVKIELRE